LQEPLGESAPLAWAEAPRRCPGDPGDGDTCIWYHRVWQYLRLLGVITTTSTNSDFLVGVFRKYAQTGGCPSVLVSATADYSVLAHLAHAYRLEDAVLRATVVDCCGTALFLNRWYAARHDVPLTTESANILEYRSARPFDLVCTHNFLGRFDATSRRRLVSTWHTLLRPGGVVVTTQRVHPNLTTDRNSYTDAEARALSARVATAVRAYPHPLNIDPDELASATFEYAMRKNTYVIPTMQELTDLFDTEGFDVELADAGGGPVERERDRPTNPRGDDSFRMRIIARRR
jgi:SAM-dependent methyltransferase